ASRRTGHRVILEARRRGVVLRPLGDAVVVVPALAMAPRTLHRLFDVLEESVDAAAR
ncbi:MAG: adenosylmethionine--8-amino-7-oxononanoate transaminase, partial [Candidatus Brocadiae bacterium]|nr:adenosylmethionine--8-amino-7-oxononanoate transaminase [Candidatus Brocadiia bacterium]